MPSITTRYANYLNGYEFYPNSISFRIHSSKALEKWKNVQAFQMNQLVNGKFFFPTDRREILLLEYDMWSRWLYEVENWCIEIGDTDKSATITNSHINFLFALADKTIDTCKDIILIKHPERFETLYARIWIEAHDIVFRYMKQKIVRLSGLRIDIMFTRIVDILCEVMQYTLIEIYELDNFYCKQQIECSECSAFLSCPPEKYVDHNIDDTPFIIISQLDKKCYKEDILLTQQRLTIYKKYFNFHKVFIKNYTDEPIDQNIIDKINDINIEIDYKKSLINS